MKNIIETSIYLIIITLSCLIFIGFVGMNRSVNTINEVTSYIQDYIEVNGSSERDVDGNYVLDAVTADYINQKVQEHGMTITYDYDAQTDNNVYYIVHVAYKLTMPVLGITKTHTYNAYARAAKAV